MSVLVELPAEAVLLWLAAVVAAQTGLDLPLTGPILPGSPLRRGGVLLLANGAALTVTALALRLALPLNHALLLASREGGWMAAGVLLAVVEAFLWMAPFVLLRLWLVGELALGEASEERRGRWRGYGAVSSIATLLLAGPLYVAVVVVPPLMSGAREAFGG